MLLNSDPCLELDVAAGEADPSTTWPGICLAVFLRDSWLHGPPNLCLDRMDFVEKFLPQWFWQTGLGGEGQVICINVYF